MSDVEDDGFVTVHHGPRPNGRWCRICLRYEVKPNGWCAKCGNHVQKPEAGDASPDQVTEILREACNIISDEAEAIRAGVQIIGTSNMSADPHDAHAVERVKELEGWIARAGVIIDQHRDEIASWKMAADEAERECKALRKRVDALLIASSEQVAARTKSELRRVDAEARAAPDVAGLVEAAKAQEKALVEAKREMWIGARSQWTMADFKNWAVIQQIDNALSVSRAALAAMEGSANA